MGLNLFLPLKTSHVSVHGDSFNSSGGINVSDSPGGFNSTACGVLLVQIQVPLAVPEISVEVLSVV